MKKFKVILVLALSVVLVFSLVACAQVGLPEGDYSAIYELENPSIQLNSDGNVELLQLSDLHLIGEHSSKDNKTIAAIDSTLKAKDYDLVVLSGDVFEGFNSNKYDKLSALNSLLKVFEDNQQPFCYVAGNNDGELLGSNESIILAFNKSQYFRIADAENVGGTGNYYIKVVNADNVEVHRLLIMDSRMRDSKGVYHHIDDTQVEFYQKVANECKELNIKLSLFMHITFDAAITAIKEGESLAGDDNYIGIKELWSDNGNGNKPLYAAIKDSGACAMISAGHLHTIDVVKYYDNIIFKVVRAGGFYSNLSDKQKHGGAEIVISPNASTVKEMYKFKTVLF